MKISIIIPNYNGGHLLAVNLPKLVSAVNAYKDADFEIIISDDVSTDNSEDVITRFKKNNEENDIAIKTNFNRNIKDSGFSKNVNRGVAISTGDIILLLNSDVIPEKDFLLSLIPHFQKVKVFAVACMEESIEDKEKDLRGRGIGKWEKGFLVHSGGDVNGDKTLWASGGSSAFRKSIWQELGGLDILYNPFYWEDIDLSYRAWKSGYEVDFEKDSIVKHEHDKGAIRNSYSKQEITSIAYRNQFIFVWKNITDKKLLFSHIYWLPYHFAMAIKSKNTALLSGFFNAFVLLPKIIQSRLKTKQKFILSDKKLLDQFHV